jgi:hypothetical protein
VTPLKATNRFTSLTIIGMTKIMCNTLGALLYDEGDKEEINESLNASNSAYYDTYSDTVDNIDEFIHVGRHRWDVVGYDRDPIYDIESHFQVLPMQLSQ